MYFSMQWQFLWNNKHSMLVQWDLLFLNQKNLAFKFVKISEETQTDTAITKKHCSQRFLGQIDTVKYLSISLFSINGLCLTIQWGFLNFATFCFQHPLISHMRSLNASQRNWSRCLEEATALSLSLCSRYKADFCLLFFSPSYRYNNEKV